MVEQGQPRAAVYGRQSRGKEKSIEEQVEICTADAVEHGWNVTATYRDRTSASRYRRRDREEWARVVTAVRAHEFDVLVLWISSRGDRDLTTWSGLLDACREQGILIRVTDDDRTYDVRRGGDWQALAQQGVSNAADSDKISTNVRRGIAGAAKQGRPPAGPCPYGYRRRYDPTTGELARQEIDEETARIVREIIYRVGRSDPVGTITRDLNARGITPPGGGTTWYRQRVRELALSPVYIGKRTHRPGRGTGHEGERAVHDATWPPLVEEAQHWAAVRVLANPARMTTARPGRQVYLLSYLATCATCSGPVIASAAGRDYSCKAGHAGVGRKAADDYVTEVLLAYVAREDVYRNLSRVGEAGDREVVAAQGEIARLRASLDQWRESAARGQTTPDSLAAIEATITRDMDAAERRVRRAAIPPVLRAILDPDEDVETRWKGLTLAARRTLIRELVTVTVRPSGRNRYAPIDARVIVEPLAREV